MTRLVCIDVDGTLVGSSGEVPPATWAATDHLRALGVRLAVCSGRPAFGVALEYARRLDASGWHIFQNGASVVRLPDGETRSRPLPAPAVAALIRRARTAGQVLELYTDTGYAVESTLPRAVQHAALLGVPFQRRPLDALHGTVVRAQWVVSHAEAEVIVAEPHDGVTIAVSTSPLMPDTAFVGVTAAGTDKGDALRRVASEYGFPLAAVMMVGDSDNDITAMRLAGRAIAMGNAEPGVIAVADTVVGHVDQGGLVEALALAAGGVAQRN